MNAKPMLDTKAKKIIALAIILGATIFTVFFVITVFQVAGKAIRKSNSKTNLLHIHIALHNYHDTYGSFPPAYTVDDQGNRLHSWRTLLLPYLEEKELYDAIDFTKPWDDPVNSKILKAHYRRFSCPEFLHQHPELKHYTSYLGVASQGGFFQGPQARQAQEIRDNISKSWAVVQVESHHAIPWYVPYDVDESYLLHSLREDIPMPHHGCFFSLMCDGTIQLFPADIPIDVRKAYLSIAGDDNSIIEEYENRTAGGTP